jgi:hypothetical protein
MTFDVRAPVANASAAGEVIGGGSTSAGRPLGQHQAQVPQGGLEFDVVDHRGKSSTEVAAIRLRFASEAMELGGLTSCKAAAQFRCRRIFY